MKLNINAHRWANDTIIALKLSPDKYHELYIGYVNATIFAELGSKVFSTLLDGVVGRL